MLDPNALAALSQLKTDIQATKDYAEGVVAATSGRFGFVRCDDGRDAFLAPEKMERVLPGDRVQVSLNENAKGKLEAELEKLQEPGLSKFVGQYRVRGKGHFVVPGGRDFSRWIFIPPQQRKGAKEGDFVIAKISRHPWRDGRAQANILFRIGQPDDAFIEHKYIKAKYDLNYRSGEEHSKQLEAVQNDFANENFGERDDLSALPFVTIDSASTLDMDDALYAQKKGDGYELKVAIADPASFLAQGSALAEQAQNCAQSVYLLGGTVPMLPAAIAHYAFSLEAEKLKPALVCSMEINANGEVSSANFSRAKLRSAAKLSYEQVANFLDRGNSDAVDESLQANLTLLAEISVLRRNYREQHMLLNDDSGDYDFSLDERGHIDSIRLRERSSANQLVEEAMVACNIAAGHFLAEHNAGLFTVHKGFREDRIGEAAALFKEEGLDFGELNTLDSHKTMHRSLSADSERSKYLPALRRLMQGAELSHEQGPHLGLGADFYATVSSPIRRFADLFNHWCIEAVLNGNKAPKLSEQQLQSLNENLRNGRQADRELQQWLLCLYAQKQVGNSAKGRVRIVTQQGFGVKLDDSGLEGFVLFGKDQEKSFDAKRLSLKVGEQSWFINDEVEIKIASVDQDKRRIAFELIS
ncbi:VacB/RNase II family 3'-5' exoribonuclease [Agaribacterium haliotis]|uniref:VacB/RNase II family 3'-5' exoribonuclease n=1 Tax=Agaribacterium haliotis TaxID=2013869 RepID=UPI000BB5361D|nr:VacB/RNase II family 3'-5' exoribonuclease [Agaribacterium haliotis]